MNCEELRSQIADGNYVADAANTEHLQRCSECRAVIHADEYLRDCLTVVRESAPQVHASLDASVMAAYRARVAKDFTGEHRIPIVRALVWSGIAASLVVGLVLLVTRWKPTGSPNALSVPAPTSSTPRIASPGDSEQTPPRVAATAAPSIRRVHARLHRPRSNKTPAQYAASAAPHSGFQNLMFCDPLSCPGPMQVIRIQVPASDMNRVPAWHTTSGMVQADVVVGSDGIARAIRIVR